MLFTLNTRVFASLIISCALFAVVPNGYCDDPMPSASVLAPGTKSRIMIGVEAGITYTTLSNSIDTTQFAFIDPYKSATGFGRTVNTGSGVGFHIALTLDAPISDRWGFLGKLQYSTLHTKLTSTNTQPCPTPGVPVVDTAVVDDNISTTIGMLSLDALARFYIVPDSWYVVGGLAFGFNMSKSYDASESIVSPASCGYLDDFGVQAARALDVTGTLNNTVPVQINIILGIGDLIPIGARLFLAPELTMAIPLTALVTNESYPATAAFDQSLFGKFYYSGLRAMVFYPTIGVKYLL